jgi:hypothetical protein
MPIPWKTPLVSSSDCSGPVTIQGALQGRLFVDRSTLLFHNLQVSLTPSSLLLSELSGWSAVLYTLLVTSPGTPGPETLAEGSSMPLDTSVSPSQLSLLEARQTYYQILTMV